MDPRPFNKSAIIDIGKLLRPESMTRRNTMQNIWTISSKVRMSINFVVIAVLVRDY